jgi:hypothetical protein
MTLTPLFADLVDPAGELNALFAHLSQETEQVRKGIHSEEMRLLDRDDAEGSQRRSEHANCLVVYLLTDQVDQQDRQDIRQRR